MKFQTIVKISEKIKDYVEKNHELPGSVTVDNVKYTYPVAGYLIAKAVNNPGKDINEIKVGKAPAPTGETVNFEISKTNYKSLAKSLTTFIEKKENRRLPNFLTHSGKKIKQRVFIYSFAKIIVFYSKQKRFPDFCGFKTSETVAKTTTKKSISQTKGGAVCKKLHKLTNVIITDYKTLYKAFYYAVYNYYLNDKKTQSQALSDFKKGNNCVDLNQLAYYALKELGYTTQIVRGTILCDKTYGHVWCRVKIGGSWKTFDASAAAKGKSMGNIICGKITSITDYNPSWAVSDDGRT